MLKNIPHVLSPELLKTLCEMGHGDEIVIADANFPMTGWKNVIRCNGVSGTEMLEAVLKVMPLDNYVDDNMVLMELMKCDEGKVNPTIWKDYEEIADRVDGNQKIVHVERFAFYEKCKNAYCVIATSESAIYANILLRKGIVKIK